MATVKKKKKTVVDRVLGVGRDEQVKHREF